jgi:CPA2 family monovalent cation:H+ antiporter-2
VGMLFDPRAIINEPWRVLTLVVLIVAWKAVLAFTLVRVLGENSRTALVIGTALGQIGEFSFIVAGLGVGLGLVDASVQALLVTAAIIAITVNGPLLALAERFAQRIADKAAAVEAATITTPAPRASMTMKAFDALYGTRTDHEFFGFSELFGHVVLVGYGRVGATVADALRRAGVPFVIIEEQERVVGGLRKHGEHAIQGDATRADVLDRAGIRHAKLLVVTAPEPIRARRIVDVAQLANPQLDIAVRTHSATEQAYFEQHLTRGRAVYAEREAALSLAHYALQAIGKTDDEADWLVSSLRGQPTAPTQTFESLPTQEYQALARMGMRGGRPSVVAKAPDLPPKEES